MGSRKKKKFQVGDELFYRLDKEDKKEEPILVKAAS